MHGLHHLRLSIIQENRLIRIFQEFFLEQPVFVNDVSLVIEDSQYVLTYCLLNCHRQILIQVVLDLNIMNVIFFVVLFEALHLALQALLVSFVTLKVQFEEPKLFGLLKELFHELIIAMLARLQLLNNLRENLNIVLTFI